MLVAVPVGGGPVGAVVPVHHVVGGEGGALRILLGRVVGGPSQADLRDIVPVHQALLGQALGSAVVQSLGCALHHPGGAAFAHLVASHQIQQVSRTVFQSAEGGAGAGQLAARLGITLGGGLFLIIHLIEGCPLRRLPGHRQGPVQGGDRDHIRRAGLLGGLGRGLNRRAGVPLPIPCQRSDLEAVGL